MQHVISDKNVVYSFSGENSPAAKAASGDELVFVTKDCFSNQLNKPEDKLEQLNWDRINPATGPVYIEGAQKGDTLKVTVRKIELSDTAVVATGRDMGLFGSRLPDTYVRIVEVKDGRVKFSDCVSLPVKPMIGVIGVAPESGAISCGTPGSHGGNMDNTMIGEEAVLYFPVFKEGALFALGDVHAVMGDGEVCVCGAEIKATVTVKVEVLKGRPIRNPIVENAEKFAAVAAEDTLDKAVETSAFDMAELIAGQTSMPREEIAMLMSLAGNAEVCQVVDPKKTARFAMPKRILADIGFSF